MKAFGAHYESLFFTFTVSAVFAVSVAVALSAHVPVPITPALALSAAPEYRLTISADRLPIECVAGGAGQGTRYCEGLLDRPASAVMRRRTR